MRCKSRRADKTETHTPRKRINGQKWPVYPGATDPAVGEGKGKEKKKFFDRSPRHKFPTLSVTQRRNQDYTSKRVVCRGVVTKLAVIKLATAKLDGTHDRMLLFLVCIYLYSIFYFFSHSLSPRVCTYLLEFLVHLLIFPFSWLRVLGFVPLFHTVRYFAWQLKRFSVLQHGEQAFARFLVVRD